MAVPTPKWHALLEGHTELDTTTARQDLSSNVRHVEQNWGRIVLTTYAKPRAALVSLKDVVVLRILDQHPELLEHVWSHAPT